MHFLVTFTFTVFLLGIISGYSGPEQTISTRKPQRGMIDSGVIFSLIGHIIILGIFQWIMFGSLTNSDWFERWESIKVDDKSEEARTHGYLSTVRKIVVA